MHTAVPRLACAALAAVRVPQVVPDLLHGETVLAVVVRHGPGPAAARQRVADPDLDVAVGRRLHGRERGQPLVLRGRHDEVAAALLARRLHLVVGAHVGRDPQAGVIGGGRLLRVVVVGGRGERAAAAGAALVPRREVAVVVGAALPLVALVPRAVVAAGIRGRPVVDARPGVVVAGGVVVVVAVVVPARRGARPAARGLARAVRGLPDGPVVGAPLHHPADGAVRGPGARAVLVAAGRVLEDVRGRRDAVLVHVGGVRRRVAGVLGARHGDVPGGEALLGRAGEARESAAVVGRLRGGRRDRARREDRRPPHHLAVLHCGATVLFCLAVGRGCPSDSHQLPRTVSWVGATHRRGALRGHGHMVGALALFQYGNLVCRTH